MHRKAANLGRRIGRRGAFLLFLALLDAIVAYSLTQPLPLGLTRAQVYQPFVHLAPLTVWAWAWAGVGALAFVGALARPVQWVAFPFAALIKTAWAVGYLVGWAGHDPLYAHGYQTAVIYLAFALITLLISGWRENDQ